MSAEKLVKLNLSGITEASKSCRHSKTTVKKGKTTPPTSARKATLKFEILFPLSTMSKALVTKPRGLNRVVKDSTVSSKESDYEELKKSSFEDSGSEEPEEMQSRDDDEVAVFNAQPDNNDSVNDTLSDYEFEAATAYFSDGVAADTYKQLEEVQSHPPAQLLEDDPEVSTSEQLNIQILKGLNDKCRSVKEQFENELEMVREVIVYSVFWDRSVSSYCEGSSHFTFPVTAAKSQDDFVAIGRILTHQFIETGTLPLQILKAIIQQAVTGRVSEECLVQSLLMLLYEKEREIL
ncbi:unnamed protein product, partial [Porites lobata]